MASCQRKGLKNRKGRKGLSLLHARPEDFPAHLRAIHRALVPGGIFHIGMKLGEGTRRDRLDRYYAYYSQDDLTEHLADAGGDLRG